MSESLLWIWRWTSCNAQTLANQKRNWIIIMLLGLSIRQGAFIREELLIHTQRHKADWSDFRFGYTTLENWSFLLLGEPTVAGWYRPFFVNLQTSYVASFAWVHLKVFTEILWCPFFGNKQGRSYDTPSLCQFTDIKNIRITRLFVCARLIDQFTKIYDPPFGSIYRELWWNICHNLRGFFNPLVFLQIEDLRPACTNILSIFC